MEREIAFRLTPMPELLERAAAESPPPVCTLFARCRTLLDELGERSMAELWREALEQVPLGLDGPGRLALEERGGRCVGPLVDGGRAGGKHSPTPVRSCPGRVEQAREAGKTREDVPGARYHGRGIPGYPAAVRERAIWMWI